MLRLFEEFDKVLAETASPGAMYVLYAIGGVAMGALSDDRIAEGFSLADGGERTRVRVGGRKSNTSSWFARPT